MFGEVFRAMFKDLTLGTTPPAEEVVPSGIPGIELVRTTITFAEVVLAQSSREPDPPMHKSNV